MGVAKSLRIDLGCGKRCRGDVGVTLDDTHWIRNTRTSINISRITGLFITLMRK